MSFQTIGIIGAGQMGSGIAHVCALAGSHILLNDLDSQKIDNAVETISKNMDRQIKKGLITESNKQDAIKNIEKITTFDAFKQADFVIEAAIENETIKNEIFQKVCPFLGKETILASNTSSISITRLAAKTDRPENFMGVHFMNPVPLMQLVELIRGIATSPDTFKKVKDYIVTIGKIPANSEDFPAFIVNRILLPMINEAIYTLYEGVGSVDAIDTALKLGANHPMGPLQLADFIGLDTCLAIMQVLYEGLGDSKYRPCPLLVKYVEAGWLGKKTSRGFYDYRGEKPIPTR